MNENPTPAATSSETLPPEEINFGQMVAIKLKKLDPDLKMEAEQVIFKIMMEKDRRQLAINLNIWYIYFI